MLSNGASETEYHLTTHTRTQIHNNTLVSIEQVTGEDAISMLVNTGISHS
jgi:hypothetical protein